jgi:hypothetical protein
MCGAVVALIAAVLVSSGNGSDDSVPVAAPVETSTTIAAPPTTESTNTTAPPTTLFPDEPVTDTGAEDKMYGWGTAQPTAMKATVHYGGSDSIIDRDRRALLADQLVQVRNAGLAIGTVAEAERLGYVKNYQRINGRGFEYVKWSNFSPTLDLDKPTVLAFEGDQPASRIISVAYNVFGKVQEGPPDDLPLEVIPWHYHSNLCEKDGTIVGSVEYDANGKAYPEQVEWCLSQQATFRPDLNHWMTDLWVIPGWENPWGLVSSKHPDMMFEPTPWFASNRTGEQDAWAIDCRIPEDAPPETGQDS